MDLYQFACVPSLALGLCSAIGFKFSFLCLSGVDDSVSPRMSAPARAFLSKIAERTGPTGQASTKYQDSLESI